MSAYYNEFKPEAAHMLRQLIKDDLIAPGDVDERPIQEVKPDDLRGYTQCHFFAGIGGWSVALRLAGWEDARPVWTGSCPCQPFSAAGKKAKQSDERHLWPDWYRLIRESKPAAIFGEQVASAITAGWWDDVAADLEAEKYACAAAVLPACSVGKPHKRDRLWFVANTQNFWAGKTGNEIKAKQYGDELNRHGDVGNTGLQRPAGNGKQPDWLEQSSKSALGNTTSERFGETGQSLSGCEERLANGSSASDVADTSEQGLERRQNAYGHAGATDLQWIKCPDGKARPVESGICLLAHGVQHRAPILHAFGNAIVPQVAAEFIKASCGVMHATA